MTGDETIRLTIKEFQEKLSYNTYNGADSKIDTLIKKAKEGKIKGEIRRANELVDGQITKCVYISKDIFNQLLLKKNKSKIVDVVYSAVNENVNDSLHLDNEKPQNDGEFIDVEPVNHEKEHEQATEEKKQHNDSQNPSSDVKNQISLVDQNTLHLFNEALTAKNQVIEYSKTVGTVEEVKNNVKDLKVQRLTLTILLILSFAGLCYLVSLNFDNLKKQADLEKQVVNLEKQVEINNLNHKIANLSKKSPPPTAKKKR